MKAVVLASLLAVTSTSALAQEVLMRRPVPGTKAGSDQPVVVNPTPTPTPTPGPGATPTPTPAPTPTPTPADPNHPADPPQECAGNCPGDSTSTDPDKGDGVGAGVGITYFASWEVGPWQGGGACGVQTTMTREVSCTGVAYRYNSDGSRDLVYDYPTKFEDRVCAELSDYGPSPKPVTRYVGSNANCSYEIVPGQFSDWSGTCGSISRSAPAVCMSNGAVVPMSRCTDNIRNGGTADEQPPQDFTEYDYTEANCRFEWNGYGAKPGACVAGERTIDYDYKYCAAFDRKTGGEAYLDRSIDNAECGALPTLKCDGTDDEGTPALSCYTSNWSWNGDGNQQEKCTISDSPNVTVTPGMHSSVCSSNGGLECCRDIYYEYLQPGSDGKMHNVRTSCTGAYHPGPRVPKEQVCPTDGDMSNYGTPYTDSSCAVRSR